MRPSATPKVTVRDIAKALLHALDPAAFARDRLGFDPDPWQTEFLRSRTPRVLLNVSRQAGKSTTAAILALHEAVYRPGSLVLLVSPSLRQSGELFRKTGEFRARLDPAPALKQDNALSTVFANGSRIVSLPGDEGTIRGFSAPRLIIEDEASRVDDGLYRAVRPMLATGGGRLVLMSTPFGQRGHLWEEWSGGGDAWERVIIKAEQVPRISPEFLAEEQRALGDTWFRQEYCCEFLQSSDQVFRPEDIARALSADVVPLFAKTPAADDPVPLFPGGGA
jgi:hypothetical protein